MRQLIPRPQQPSHYTEHNTPTDRRPNYRCYATYPRLCDRIDIALRIAARQVTRQRIGKRYRANQRNHDKN